MGAVHISWPYLPQSCQERHSKRQAKTSNAKTSKSGFITPNISYVLSLILSVTLTSFTAPYNSWLELLGRVSKLFYLSAVITVLVLLLYWVPTIWSSGHLLSSLKLLSFSNCTTLKHEEMIFEAYCDDVKRVTQNIRTGGGQGMVPS